jgi:hypothetical protein
VGSKSGQVRVQVEVGNGEKVRFWKDTWVGSASLAIQFWDIYSVINE